MADNCVPQSGEERPMLRSGTFVNGTGLAVVHERDAMIPTLGAEAATRADAKLEQPL